VAKGPEAFRTISEAADELSVPQHVLRFWETKFAFIRPMKRAGGRRFYRPSDIAVLRGVRRLLHDEGYTLKGGSDGLYEALRDLETAKQRLDALLK
jgi:DNA-binding transcriptional MerR regulator